MGMTKRGQAVVSAMALRSTGSDGGPELSMPKPATFSVAALLALAQKVSAS
jgi:hypothetical protein